MHGGGGEDDDHPARPVGIIGLLALGTQDGRIRLENAETGELRWEVAHSRAAWNCVNAACFSSDGTRVATGSEDRSWKIWSTESGIELLCVPGHDGYAGCSCQMDERGLCKAVAPHCPRWGHSWAVNDAAFSPCGRWLATGGEDGLAAIWDAHSGKVQHRLWREDEGDEERWRQNMLNEVLSVCFSPDGHKVAKTESQSGRLSLWSAITGTLLLTIAATDDMLLAASFTSDNAHIATADGAGAASVWTCATGSFAHALDSRNGYVRALAHAPMGIHLATGGQDCAVRLWDARSGSRAAEMRGHHRGACACGPPGEPEHPVWHPPGVDPACPVAGHREPVVALAWAPRGTVLASGSADGTAKLWDAHAGALLRTANAGAPVRAVAVGRFARNPSPRPRPRPCRLCSRRFPSGHSP